jgi:pimeloyl-ACP methyl ester carboxylesterase
VSGRAASAGAVELDGCAIAYDVEGEGRPIVLLHGLGTSRAIWAGLRPRLGGRTVAVDLRGAGESVERSPAELSLARWAEDLRAVLGELGVSRPVLIGHSLGCSVAMKYASTWPDDVAALVLIGAEPRLSSLAPRMRAAAEGITEIGLERWVAERWVENPPFSDRSLERAPELVDAYRALLLGNDQDSYVRTCLAIAGAEDLTPALGSIGAPALVISGGEDDRTVPEAGAELARALGDGRFVEIEGVGHTIPTEAPEEVYGAIASFLAEIGLDAREGAEPC